MSSGSLRDWEKEFSEQVNLDFGASRKNITVPPPPRKENRALRRARYMMNEHMKLGNLAGADFYADRIIDMALGAQG